MELKKVIPGEAEINGVWFTYADTDFKMLIASINCPAWQRYVNRGSAQSRLANLSGGKSEGNDEFIRAVAEHILLDWENLTDGGKPVAYSKQAAVKLLKDSPEISRFVMSASSTKANFEDEADSQAVENLGKG